MMGEDSIQPKPADMYYGADSGFTEAKRPVSKTLSEYLVGVLTGYSVPFELAEKIAERLRQSPDLQEYRPGWDVPVSMHQAVRTYWHERIVRLAINWTNAECHDAWFLGILEGVAQQWQ